MTETPLYRGEQIKRLIPQREPIIMVDAFYEATDKECRTGLTITSENIFCKNNSMEPVGIIEHIAQSASAHTGYMAMAANLPAPVGYIGEIKNFNCHRPVSVGDKLSTTIILKTQVLNILMIDAETKVNGEIAATCQMKISIEN